MSPVNKPIKIKQRRDVNIGLIVFLFVLVYICIHFIIYATKKEITIYEVKEGNIYSDENYKGLILREETVEESTVAGYVNYYYTEGEKVAKSQIVYSINSDKDIYSKLSSNNAEIKLSDKEISELKHTITKFYLSADSFADYEGFKSNILTDYNRKIDRTLVENLNDIIRKTGVVSDFLTVKTDKSGVVSYYIDDLSDLKEENITSELYKKDDTVSFRYTSDIISKGTPVYKLITSNDWKIVILINEDIYKKLVNITHTEITIDGSITVDVPITLSVKGEDYYCTASLSKYITDFLDKRIVSISFKTSSNDGLKIPVSAITAKNYYRIPKEYFAYYPASKERKETYCLYVEYYDSKSGMRSHKETETEIFLTEGDYIYVDADKFPSDTYVTVSDDSLRSMLYIFSVPLDGVYNTNNGYASFRRIEPIKNDGEYVLVKKGTPAGLSEFDHIALKSEGLFEDKIIY